MGVTTIEWTATKRADGSLISGYTFNPWRGCTRVSEGCRFCYAEAMSRRNPAVLGEWGPGGVRAIASESYWKKPLAWDREAEEAGERRKVFCASLADVFEDYPGLVLPRLRLFRLIEDTPNLDWLLLTKRPENIERMWPHEWVHDSSCPPWQERRMSLLEIGQPSNIWAGVSVEDQARADERIPLLLQIPAAVRFLSVEPLLGPIDLTPWLSQLSWIIAGGESGYGARPCKVAWIRSVIAQCRAAKIPVFVKQLGSRAIDETSGLVGKDTLFDLVPVVTRRLRDAKGGSMQEWPEDLRIRQFPEEQY